MPAVNPDPRPDELRFATVVCRGGLEPVVAGELRENGITVRGTRTRAVDIETDLAGIYRANMGLRSALNVLLPIRTFNARNYDLLYYQSRKTNWHKLFPATARLRIDVKGRSKILQDSRYVMHRVKDGITDTFTKLAGQRPSIDKRHPDVHVVVRREGQRVTLALDTSGVPLFKRGYREDHGEAPLKEDLAAGMIALSGWDRAGPLIDPMCGSGTLLFEAWMQAARIAPNRDRRFGFEMLAGYEPEIHRHERERLAAGERGASPGPELAGLEIDEETCVLADDIRRRHFPDAPIRFRNRDFRHLDTGERFGAAVCNPPYGVRLGKQEEIARLYRDLGQFLRERVPGGQAAIYTANADAASHFGGVQDDSIPLLNGSLEGRLYRFQVQPTAPDPSPDA